MNDSTDGNVDYGSLIAEAEKAVEKMSDPKLKEIAFGRILDHLLSTSSGEPTTKHNAGRRSTRKPSGSAQTKDVKSDGPLAWLRELADENFFATPKSSKDIQDELDKRSHCLKATDLTLPLKTLCLEKKLQRDRRRPEGGGKKVLHWFNR
ncbi:MAG TPA: hypothetical protein PK595_03690 [Bacteroidota bacterium]|nr:hypothetical protein [Bacteroidota bacterium]